MLPVIYKVKHIEKGTLSVMAKPVSGDWIEDEFIGLKRLGVDKVVSLLEYSEQVDLGLEEEEVLCIKNKIEFSSFPIPDRCLPETRKAIDFIRQIYSEICSGKHIVIHCRAGIGRTGIIAGGILIKSGIDPKKAIDCISLARGVQIPDTDEQEAWLYSLCCT